jgi:hypothetical protein
MVFRNNSFSNIKLCRTTETLFFLLNVILFDNSTVIAMNYNIRRLL